MALIREIKPDGRYDGIAAVKRVESRKKRDGGPYLAFTFSDRSGEVNANYWNPAQDEFARFAEGDVVLVKGKGRSWQGNTELEVEKVEKAPAGSYSPEAFVEASERPPAESLKIIREHIAQVQRLPLRTLLTQFADDPRLATAPAAKGMHHAVFGGLAEHIATLLLLTDRVTECYPELDRDLVVAGIILHDIGKLEELEITVKVDYTTRGRLLGHIFEGCRMFLEKAAAIPDFPDDVKLKLLHIILSHHGSLEFGSPVLPQTLEAIVVHKIDELDAKYGSFKHHIQNQMEEGSAWTKYHKLLERFLYFDGGTRKEDTPNG